MKKIKLLLSLLVVLVLVFTGCQPKESTEPATEPATTAEAATEAPAGDTALVDGTYTASFSHSDTRGWRPIATLKVEGGAIVSALMDYTTKDGKLKSEDEEYGKNMSAKTKVTPKEAYEQLSAAVVAKQAADVDAVTGATHSSEFFVEMMEGLIEKAKTGDTAELILEMNGDYTAKGVADERGWIPQITLTYQDGKITAVVFDEMNAEGVAKSKDADYATRMKEKSNTTPPEVYAALQAKLVETQDPDQVDAVTGATTSSGHFVELAKKAMSNRIPK